MSNTKLIQYIHRPNMTELGMGNTHETYMLVQSGIDLSCIFPPSVNVQVKDASGKHYFLKSAVGNEFRVNQLGELYRDYNVMPGDEIIITKVYKGQQSEVCLNVNKFNRVVLLVGTNGTEVVNIDRLKNYVGPDGVVKLKIYDRGAQNNLEISFFESRKKRSDSPNETDFYNVNINGNRLANGTYYLTICDNTTLLMLPKSEFNTVEFDEHILSDDLPPIPSKVEKPSVLYSYNHLLLQQIFYGAPGTGKSNTIKEVVDDKHLSHERTTFHPDSDYSTFVGAYKPTTKQIPMRDVTGKVIKENGADVTEDRIVYEFVPQAFLKAYTSAWKDLDKPFFLIIEEINRGNCAQIFGDLFQLLDRKDSGFSDYPIKADADIKRYLQKAFNGLSIEQTDKINGLYNGRNVVEQVLAGDILLLPNNLFIWATMNTSDQSLFPIDSAFKRRWDWKYVPISDAKKGWKIEANGKRYDWWQFLQKINDKIEAATYSEDKKLGYFFCKAKDGIIDAETFVGKVLFYLWNDVFKDNSFDDDKTLFTDEDGTSLSYHKFYTVDDNGNAKIAEDKVVLLLKNLDLVPVEVEESEIEEIEEEGSIPNTGLRVLFNGRTYNEKTSIETFAKVIEAIGVERVASMGLTCASYPLLSKERLDNNVEGGYGHGLRRIGDYWMISKYSNKQKETFLRRIKESLNLDLEII